MASIINVNEVGPAAGFSTVTVNSDLTVNTLKSKGTSFHDVVSFQNASGTQNGTLCRAWVNFDASGTVSIRDSFNVSTITDHAVGDYTINFTNSFPDANYCMVTQSAQDPAVNTAHPSNAMSINWLTGGATASNVRVRSGPTGGAGSGGFLLDALYAHAAFFY